jgi:quercetin dioxygenase-like cupin family protein
MTRLMLFPCTAAILALVVMNCSATAQQSAVHRTTLQQEEFPSPLHTVTVRTLVDPLGEVRPHTHPGVEMAYIVSGTASVTIAGQGEKIVKEGGSFAVPPNTVHSVKNTTNAPLVLISTYVVDPSKPIAQAAKQN